MKISKKFLAVCAVWGEKYTKSFLQLSLPSFLAPGNLLDFDQEITLEIYTTQKTLPILEQSETIQFITRKINTRIIAVADDLIMTKNVYEAMTLFHNKAVLSAVKQSAGLIFLSPDIIMANATFQSISDILNKGYRVILIGSVRIEKEGLEDRLTNYFQENILSINSRDLVRIAANNLHPFTRALSIQAKNFIYSSHLYHKIEQEGFIAKCLHLHPLVVLPQNPNASISDTCDGDYLATACPNIKDYYIVEDSDQLFLCEFSEKEKFKEIFEQNNLYNPIAFALHILRKPLFFNSHHLRIFRRHTLHFHQSDFSLNWEKQTQYLKKDIRFILIIVFLLKPFYFLYFQFMHLQKLIRKIAKSLLKTILPKIIIQFIKKQYKK